VEAAEAARPRRAATAPADAQASVASPQVTASPHAITQPATATASEATAPLARDQERFDTLVKGLEARLHVSRAQGGGSLRMTLKPEALGEVVIRLNMTAQGAVATLVADNAAAGTMLAQAAGELHKALLERGVQLDRLDVSTSGGTAPDPHGGFQSQTPGREAAASQRTLYSFRADRDDAATPDSPATADAASGVSYLA
jgi:flagellar hook-length control protein FliK